MVQPKGAVQWLKVWTSWFNSSKGSTENVWKYDERLTRISKRRSREPWTLHFMQHKIYVKLLVAPPHDN